MGSLAEAVLDCLEDEEESGRAKPLDIEYLLANVIPAILSLSGMIISCFCCFDNNNCNRIFICRISFLTRKRFRIC